MTGGAQARGEQEPVPTSRVVVELGTESAPELIRFCIGERPARGGTYDSYALRAAEGWILLDPIRPTPDGVDRLRRLIGEPPVATVLTSDGHERVSNAVRQRWGTPVWGPVLGEAERDPAYERQPDHFYTAGDALPGGLRAIKLAGAWRGDHALLWRAPAGQRVLFSGDILNGPLEPDLSPEDHYRRQPGLYFGARPAYVERHINPAALKASLEQLLHEEFDLVAGSHGCPFSSYPRDALAALLQTI